MVTTVVTSGGIEAVAEQTHLFFDYLEIWIPTFLGFIVALGAVLNLVGSSFKKIGETLRGKAEKGDVDGVLSSLTELSRLLKEVTQLQELSALANLDNKFLDDEIKAGIADVLAQYNTVDTLTKDQWERIRRSLSNSKGE